MKNLNSCPVCQNELPKVNVFFVETARVCDHCHHKIFPKKWIRTVSLILTLSLLIVFYSNIQTMSGLFFIIFYDFFVFLLTKVYGFDYQALDEEEYLEEKAKLNVLDSQGLNKNQQSLKLGLKLLGLSIIFFFSHFYLYRLNIIDFDQMYFLEGITTPIAWLFVSILLMYLFKDKWYYRLTLNKVKFIPLMISIIGVSHIFSLMLNFFVFDLYEPYFDLYFTKLLYVIVISIFVQILIIKKTNLK